MEYLPQISEFFIFYDPYVVLFVSPEMGLDVSHMGIFVRKENEDVLRHASSSQAKVVEEPFMTYLYNSHALGIILLRIRR